MGNPIYPFACSKFKTNKSNTSQTKPNPEVPQMGWPGLKTILKTSSEEQVQKPMLTPAPSASLSHVEPERRRRSHRPGRGVRLLRSLCRTFPVFNPKCTRVPGPCKMISNAHVASSDYNHHHTNHTASSLSSTARITGTLFGHRRGRVSFSFQENSRCLPSLVLELAIQTQTLLREIGSGMVRIALECEKHPELKSKDQPRLLDEPIWTMYCNGKKCGYGIRRDANEEDLKVMETLCPVSMGAGVIPGNSETERTEGELAYVRAFFEHVVGSRDSETLYMLSPDGRNGPELTLFFVRI